MKRYYLGVAALLCIFLVTQVAAKVTWLPDYLENNKDTGGKRVNDGGKNTKADRDCAVYSLLGKTLPAHMTGKGMKNLGNGLTCWEEYLCDKSYYGYTTSNCPSPKVLGGENCSDRNYKGKTSSTVYYRTCSCPAEYNLSSCPSNANCQSCDSSHYKFTGCKTGYKQDPSTSAPKCVLICGDYPLTACPTGGICSTCPDNSSKKKLDRCDEARDYRRDGNTCVANCTNYPLTACPAGGSCSNCPENSSKKKLDSCDASKGWSKSGNTCDAVACPTGFAAGVTSCTSDSTKPDITLNGWSGGRQCGMCSCKASGCDATLTSCPEHAICSSCVSGCGSNKVTLYKFDKCEDGYTASGTTCVNACNGYTLTSCPSNANCSQCGGKYKFDSCKQGYYTLKDGKSIMVETGVIGSVSSGSSGSSSNTVKSEYSCRSCSGTLIGKDASCPSGMHEEVRSLASGSLVDKKCCLNCSDSYNLTACPENATCNECGGKYMFSSCKSGYYRPNLILFADDGTTASTSESDEYNCEKCSGTMALNGSSCPTGNISTAGRDNDRCCINKTISGGGTGITTPTDDCSDLQNATQKVTNKTYWYNVVGGSSLGMYEWWQLTATIKAGETCESLKKRLTQCGITNVSMNCQGCVCGLGKSWQLCNGGGGTPVGVGCSGSSSGGGSGFAVEVDPSAPVILP